MKLTLTLLAALFLAHAGDHAEAGGERTEVATRGIGAGWSLSLSENTLRAGSVLDQRR